MNELETVKNMRRARVGGVWCVATWDQADDLHSCTLTEHAHCGTVTGIAESRIAAYRQARRQILRNWHAR